MRGAHGRSSQNAKHLSQTIKQVFPKEPQHVPLATVYFMLWLRSGMAMNKTPLALDALAGSALLILGDAEAWWGGGEGFGGRGVRTGDGFQARSNVQ